MAEEADAPRTCSSMVATHCATACSCSGRCACPIVEVDNERQPIETAARRHAPVERHTMDACISPCSRGGRSCTVSNRAETSLYYIGELKGEDSSSLGKENFFPFLLFFVFVFVLAALALLLPVLVWLLLYVA